MKKLVYQVEGYTNMYNPETEEVEKVLSPITVVVENPTDEQIARAAEIAYKGEYTIEDDGQNESIAEPTQLDILDARLTYIEMMTGLLEV